MNRIKTLAFVAVVFAGATAVWGADKTVANDAIAIGNATLSLSDAIQVAEQNAKGKAVRAEYENANNASEYSIEVVKDSKVYDVKVDAIKGNVISTLEDKIDSDRDE